MAQYRPLTIGLNIKHSFFVSEFHTQFRYFGPLLLPYSLAEAIVILIVSLNLRLIGVRLRNNVLVYYELDNSVGHQQPSIHPFVLHP